MKLKEGYILREVVGEYVLIPVGSTAVSDNGVTMMTETGALIYRGLSEGKTKDEILREILETYETTPEEAESDLNAYLDQLRGIGLLTDEE